MPSCMMLLKRYRTAGCLLITLAVTLLLPVVSDPQQPAGHKEVNVRFTSPDGTFAFEYPNWLIKCERDPKQSDWWIPARSCEAYTPVFTDAASTKDATVVCIAFPAGNSSGLSALPLDKFRRMS